MSLLRQAFNHQRALTRVISLVNSTRHQSASAPIKVYGVEGRYAHALYSAATKEKQLDPVNSDLQKVKEVLSSEPRVEEFLSNPSLQKSIKQDALEKILKTQKVTPLTVNFFNVMAENGRLKKTRDVIAAFDKIMSAHRGEVVCTVCTAKPLDDKHLKELKDALQGFLTKGQQLIVKTKVDSEIIGGMVVEIGDKYVDLSIRSKVKLYERVIREAVP